MFSRKIRLSNEISFYDAFLILTKKGAFVLNSISSIPFTGNFIKYVKTGIDLFFVQNCFSEQNINKNFRLKFAKPEKNWAEELELVLNQINSLVVKDLTCNSCDMNIYCMYGYFKTVIPAKKISTCIWELTLKARFKLCIYSRYKSNTCHLYYL